MTSLTFSRLQEIFWRATDLEGPAREAFLAAEARTWPDLVDKVRDLLRADESLREAQTVRPALVAPATEPLEAGQRIGPFVVRELLGQGGMGSVYLAERAGRVEQRVAIKILQGAWLDAAGRRRFQVESQILARLEHPAIARLIDVGATADGAPYLVMEYIRGASISQYCDRQKLGVEARVRLIRRVCEAVSFAHRNLIIHRDLKPDNVLITEEGRVKLVDFGIAKPLTVRLGRIDVEKTDRLARVFSPAYAAPEQITGDPTTVATDVYGLGVVLYELLSGERPFAANDKTPREVEEAVLHQEPIAPSHAVSATDATSRDAVTARSLRRRLRGDLDSIALKCLHKSAEGRYLSTSELAGDLDRFLTGRPVLAREGRLAYRAGKFLRRHRLVVAAAATVAVAVLGAAIAVVLQAVETRRERDRARFVTDFMVSAFEAADPTQSLGADITAAQILEQSLRQLDAEDPANPAAKAELLLAIARVQDSLGLGKEARSTLDRATAHFESAAGDRDLETRLLLTRTTLALGDHDIETTRSLARLGLAKRHLSVAQRLRFELLVAMSFFRTSQYEIALARFEEMLPRLAGLGPESSALRFEIRNEHGGALERLGRNQEALAVYEAVLEERRRALPPQHPGRLDSIQRIATLYSHQGRAEDLNRLAAEILERTERLYGPNSLAMGRAFNTRGTGWLLDGNFPAAVEQYQKALQVYRLHYGDIHPQVAMRAFNIAFAAGSDPALHETADTSFRQSIEIGSAAWPEHHRNLHHFRAMYALFLNEQGRFTESLEQAAAALADAEARPEYKNYDAYPMAELAHAIARLASGSQQAKADVEYWLKECSTLPPERRAKALPQARIAASLGIETATQLLESH